MKKLSNVIESIEKAISIVLIAAITLILFFSVIYRYFLNDPIFWASEASIFMMAWLTFLGGSLGLKYRSQASISFFVDSLSGGAKRVMNICTYIIILISLAILMFYSYDWIFSLTGTKSSSMRIPMWIPYLSVPVGLTFAFIHLLDHLIDFIKDAIQGRETI
jgi:C4-dicarboxylate transporter DctQ subunit